MNRTLVGRIHGIRLPLIPLPEKLIRVSQRKFTDPIHWSRLGIHRFDSPGAKYGVLYTSNRIETSVLEVFGDQWMKDRQVSLKDLESCDVCELEVRGSVKVLDATGKHLNRLGTDSNFFVSTDYSVTQAWASALMTHPRGPAGIRYNSRKNPRRINYAIVGSAAAKSSVRLVRRYPLIDYGRLFRFLFQYEVEVL
ncbi:MAG TPA: RES family NAD+ phosphorylase [Chthoniobacterales bacterium]|nr:RES family NAD+ phosphorylase [Chthoniobacterales bacterium]